MNYIVYDLEATCWQSEYEARGKKQEIIEIGALKIDNEGNIDSRFESFVRPVFHPTLTAFCTDLTSITQVDVNQADKFPIVIEDFQDWIGMNDDEEYLLCSWGFFDKSALVKNCKLHKLGGDWAKKHINLKDQYPRIKGLGRSMGLKRAVENEGFDFDGIHHRAISDAENLAKIFIRYLPLWRW
jgi:inhibitor of KinA sporulation pathway (predicted exonuclease)